MELKPNSAEIAFSGVWLSGSESKRTASFVRKPFTNWELIVLISLKLLMSRPSRLLLNLREISTISSQHFRYFLFGQQIVCKYLLLPQQRFQTQK